jgi:hypothetical protein
MKDNSADLTFKCQFLTRPIYRKLELTNIFSQILTITDHFTYIVQSKTSNIDINNNYEEEFVSTRRRVLDLFVF